MRREILSKGVSLWHTEGKYLPMMELRGLSVVDNKVFCGPPWYEGEFCERCLGMKPTKVPDPDTEACKKCGAEVITLENRMAKVQKELSEDLSYVAILKNEDDRVVGYSFGYRYKYPESFVRDNYKTEKTQDAVLEVLKKVGITGDFYYYSGMGIESGFRGRGFSHYLGKVIDDYAISQGLCGLTRTLYDSPIVKMRERLGFKIIAGLNIDPQVDFENPQRVLLVRHITRKNT